jgi:hypothetical protein
MLNLGNCDQPGRSGCLFWLSFQTTLPLDHGDLALSARRGAPPKIARRKTREDEGTQGHMTEDVPRKIKTNKLHKNPRSAEQGDTPARAALRPCSGRP